jgi:phage terminase small subunit
VTRAGARTVAGVPRPPKPSHLRLIDGNPGKRSGAEGVSAGPGRPRVPAELRGRPAGKHFALVCDLLTEIHALSVADRLSVQLVAVELEEIAQLERELAGELTVVTPKGDRIIDPRTRLLTEKRRRLFVWLGELGLTPVARRRVLQTSAPAADTPQSKSRAAAQRLAARRRGTPS